MIVQLPGTGYVVVSGPRFSRSEGDKLADIIQGVDVS